MFPPLVGNGFRYTRAYGKVPSTKFALAALPLIKRLSDGMFPPLVGNGFRTNLALRFQLALAKCSKPLQNRRSSLRSG